MNNKFIKIVFLFTIFCGLVGIVGCSKDKEEEEIELSSYQKCWIEDIEMIRDIFSKTPGIDYRLSNKMRNKEIDDLIDCIKKNEYIEEVTIYYKLCEIISDIEIGHMRIIPSIEFDTLYYPISGKWFGNDFYIMSTSVEYQEIIGGVLKKINGIDLNEVLNRFDTIVSNENKQDLKKNFEYNFKFSKNVLDYLEFIKNDNIILTVEKNNKLFKVEVSPQEYYNFNNIVDNGNGLPMWEKIYHENKEAPFSFVFDNHNKTLYFQYNKCYDNSMVGYNNYPNFEKFFDNMIEYMKLHKKEYKDFIIDLRYNTGGNSGILEEALNKHKEFLKKQNIKVLIGKKTYSSGQKAIEDILTIISDDIKLYGEETGNSVLNYTDINQVILPISRWSLYTVKHEQRVPSLKKRQKDHNRGVIPDFEVDMDYNDYINGIDTVYEYAIAH